MAQEFAVGDTVSIKGVVKETKKEHDQMTVIVAIGGNQDGVTTDNEVNVKLLADHVEMEKAKAASKPPDKNEPSRVPSQRP